MKELKLIVFALASALIVSWTCDYAVLQYRMVTHREALGSVTVYRYYAVEKKANKVEYDFRDSQVQTCVHALYPHMDYLPCWYLQRHTEIRTDI